jgi:hypothetical protein
MSRGLLARVVEHTALEDDRAARCDVCGHSGRQHEATGCQLNVCPCRVPLRLIRCVVVPVPLDTRYGLTPKGWAYADADLVS